MCGRFTLATPADILAALFEVDQADWNDARYNIAPQTRLVTVRAGRGGRSAQSLLWGVVRPKTSSPLINARSETVATSPLFARAFSTSRVLVPADGFFEWTKDRERRLGRYFTRPQGGAFAFAGLAVAPPDGSDAEDAAVILTTEASRTVKDFHDRMPVIVAPSDFSLWLGPDSKPKAVLRVLQTASATEWASHPVGPRVNNVRNDSPENIRPAEPTRDPQQRLF